MPACPARRRSTPADGYRADHRRRRARTARRRRGAICRQARPHGLVASGSFSTDVNEIAVGNSHGVFAYAPARRRLTTVIMGDERLRLRRRTSMDVDDDRRRRVGAEAVEKAIRSRDPATIEPGPTMWCWKNTPSPRCWTTWRFIGLGALSVQEGRSFMRLGEPITGREYHTSWTTLTTRAAALAFDFEGVPKQTRGPDRERHRQRGGLRQLHRRARAGQDQHRPRPARPQHLWPHPAQPAPGAGHHPQSRPGEGHRARAMDHAPTLCQYRPPACRPS